MSTHSVVRGGHSAPVAYAEPLLIPALEITEDQAVERLIELEQREIKSQFDTALEMGDVVCQFARGIPVGDAANVYQRLSERTGISVSTLKTRGLVAERIPASVRNHPNFRTCGSFTVFEEITLVSDVARRAELFEMVLTQPAPEDAKQKRWRVNDIRALLGRSLATSWTAPVSDEERKAALIELASDPNLMSELVNDRDNGISVMEQAFFTARASYVLEQAENYTKGREEARDAAVKAALDNPNLQNFHFVNGFRRRVQNDAQRYMAFAADLDSPALQAFGGTLASTRGAFEHLLSAVQKCLDALPGDNAVDNPVDNGIIDVEAREAMARLSLPEPF